MAEVIFEKENKEPFGVLLVSLYFSANEAEEAEKSLEELKALAQTALIGQEEECEFFYLTQCRPSPEAATYIGVGKMEEAAQLCENHNIQLVIFDCELSPSQIRNLENGISPKDSKLRVIDRTMLILDIFAHHAVTGEGKLQVEIAQLKYTAPRLTGKGIEMSRQGGASSSGSVGARGPGETKLETDRRHIKRRIASLEEQLETLENTRDTMRKQRRKSNIPVVAIVGYTNAGKSTLLNYLTNAGILAEDKLFATLDPTVRKLELPSGFEVLLTDTVGFINNLPHGLVKAFKSTLDEAKYADILLILIDASDENAQMKTEVTEKTLAELGAGGKPTIYVFNKCDRLDQIPERSSVGDKKAVFVSATTGYGTDELLSIIEGELGASQKKLTFLFPFSDGGKLDTLYSKATVLSVDYTENGTLVEAMADSKISGMLEKYIVK
ncbi:MAG: GTPase HflX [Ruminococcaceae bacterium]|nr:GTPase HflX [Oscillospiraceae bacterium]